MLEFTPLFNLFLALCILVFATLVYLFFYLREARSAIKLEAYKLYFETSRKADILPQIMSRLRIHDSQFDFGRLIELRARSLALDTFNDAKRQLDDELWSTYAEINAESSNWPGVSKDHLLSALRTDLEGADERVVQMKKGYNELVAKYNKMVSFFLLKPLVLILGAERFAQY